MTVTKREGRRKRKSDLGLSDVIYAQEEGHGSRVKPVATFAVIQNVLQSRDPNAAATAPVITKKSFSPSAISAAAKITARAKARMCLLEDYNKENGSPRMAAGFRSFRGTKRKIASPEGICGKGDAQVGEIELPPNLVYVQPGRRAGGEEIDADALEATKELCQFACKSNSEWAPDADLQTAPMQHLGPDVRIRCTNSDAGLQSSQDSSRPVGPKKEESMATEFHDDQSTTASKVERQQQGTDKRSEASIATVRPVAVASTLEDRVIKLGHNSLRHIRHQLSTGGITFSSSKCISKDASSGMISSQEEQHNSSHVISQHSYDSQEACNWTSNYRLPPSKAGLKSALQAERIFPGTTANGHHMQPSGDIPRSGHSTLTVRVNPNLTRQSSLMSACQSLFPIGRKTRVFKASTDSFGALGGRLSLLDNCETTAFSGIGEDKVKGNLCQTQRAPTNVRGSSVRKALPHPSRFAPNHLPLPPRQKMTGRSRKGGNCKTHPLSVDTVRERMQGGNEGMNLAATSGLLGEFNPGIISRVRDCKQVQAILGAVVGVKAMEALARIRLQQEGEQNRCDLTVVANSQSEDDQRCCTEPASGAAAEVQSIANCIQASSCDGRYKRNLGPTGGTASKDVNSLPEHAFQMNPQASSAVPVGTVACRWLELLVMDIKGRLAALKRSRRRFRNVVASGELDTPDFPLMPSDIIPDDLNASKSRKNAADTSQQGLQMNSWRRLFKDVDGFFGVQGSQLESSLKHVSEMQMKCRRALEYATDPSSELSDAERRQRQLALADAAASVLSTTNFSFLLCS